MSNWYDKYLTIYGRPFSEVPNNGISLCSTGSSMHFVDEFVQLKAAKIALCAKNSRPCGYFLDFFCIFAAMSE